MTQGSHMKRINLSGVSAGIAVVSLFVALGGPAQAAALFTGAHIKNGSLTGLDVRNGSLRSGDIKDRSLLARDFRAGQLPAGAKGDTGAAGPAGPEGPSRWVLVNAAGVIEQQSGGFRIANAYPSSGPGVANGANGNVYIESGDADLTNNGIVATIALQNTVDQGGSSTINNGSDDSAADGNPEFSGEITVSQCALANIVACAPMDVNTGGAAVPTNAKNYFVVSPRLSDGRRTSDASSPVVNNTPNRKRFYVVLSGPRD